MSAEDGANGTYYLNPNGPVAERVWTGGFNREVDDAWEQQRWQSFLDQALLNVGPDAGFAFTAEACEMLEDTSRHPNLRASLLLDQIKRGE